MSGAGTGGMIGGLQDPGAPAFTRKLRASAWLGAALVALPALGLTESNRADDTVVHTIGTAYDLRSDQPLYSEAHCATGDALEREVIYRDAGERLIAHKTLDYRTGQATPSYLQRNFYAGESIAVALRDDTLEMTVGDLAGAGEKSSARLDAGKPLVIDAGFDAFVREHWDALVAGQTLRFDFPFAARESLFTLRIGPSPCSYDTATDQCFRLELDNWVLRALLDPIELGYDAGHKRLTRYRGLSNIGDGAGEGQVVDIRYRYENLPAVACELGDAPLAETALNFDASSAVKRL